MKRLLLLVALAVLVAASLGLLAAPALASATPPGSACPTATSPPGPPPGSHLVVNVSETFINQEDSGGVGYWALDNGLARIRIWQVPGGSFYVLVTPCATFTTFATVPSPNCDANGLPREKACGTGVFSGWVALTFTATAYTPKCGYLGVFDDGGSRADILLGWYDLQQGPNNADLLGFMSYFTNWDNLTVVGLHEVYHYGCQTMVTTDQGTTGNIVLAR